MHRCWVSNKRKWRNLQIKKYLTPIVFGLIGQLGCWGLMMGGQAITTLDNALIIHAAGAPVLFGIFSYIYFKRFNLTTPIQTALIFVGVVICMDVFVVAMMINHSFEMFYGLIGTWIPFTLIFSSTYLTGRWITNSG